MRLIYLSIEAPREGQAGFAHVHEIIKGLRGCGWDVTLFQPSYTNKDVSPSLVVRLLHALWLQIALWMSWCPGAVFYIRGHYLAFPVALICKFFCIPIFHEINGPYDDVFITHPSLNKFRRVLVWMQRQQYRWATGLVAVTEDLRRWARVESNDRPCAYISNGANTDVFYPIPDSPEIQEYKPYALFFGSLAQWHGIDIILEAAQSPQWPKGVSLLIIGEGPGSDSARRAAANHKHIHMLGRKPYAELPRYIGSALVSLVTIINPANRSGTGLMPLKLFESLSCGVPVVVTNFAGQADFVRKYKCGVIIEPNDASSLARTVENMHADQAESQAMGQRGREAVVTDYSWKKKASDTDEFIVTLLKR